MVSINSSPEADRESNPDNIPGQEMHKDGTSMIRNALLTIYQAQGRSLPQHAWSINEGCFNELEDEREQISMII